MSEQNISERQRHHLQWFVLSELQFCQTQAAFSAKKLWLYDWARNCPFRGISYYLVSLLEEVKRNEKTGLVFFSDKIKAVHLQNTSRGNVTSCLICGKAHLKIWVNKNYHRADPFDNFRI